MDNARVLIVEDEKIIALDLKRTLQRLNYSVVATASSGEAAVSQALQLSPDVVLMDIRLQGVLDGIEAADYIRAQCRIPVIYLTSHTDQATVERAKVTEPFGYILKPFDERELHIAIEMVLYRHQMERKLRGVERWLHATLTSIGDAVITTDLSGAVTFMNPIAEALTGWSMAAAVGQPSNEVFKIVHASTRQMVPSPIHAALLTGIVAELAPNTILLSRNGRETPIDDSAAPIRDEHDLITGAVLVFRDITERELAEERLRYLALHDQLTGLFNRAMFNEQLARALERKQRIPAYDLAVLFLDLDRFKIVNDSLGHLYGDQLLIAVARRIEGCLRTNDIFARLGGDEFIILLDNILQAADALRVAERIHEAVQAPLELNGHTVFVGTSIGIALSGPQYECADDLVRDADLAMYRAKAQGKGCSAVFDPQMHLQAVGRLQLESALRYAIERNQLQLAYQPIIELASGRLSGFEALVRWVHPERGIIVPDAFIPLAEETGLIVPIGWWVLREACRSLHAWQQQFANAADLTLSVNVSGKQLAHPEMVTQVAQILQETGVNPQSVQLEMTESVLMDHTEALAVTFSQLRELGVRLHLDDFGTGYSSLSVLHHFPISTVKIDRSFVQQLGVADEPTALVETIIVLAQKLGLEVVAEGVEQGQQREQLQALDCGYGQGYLFSRPLDAAAITRLLARPTVW